MLLAPMRPPRYALEPLARVRKQKVDEAAQSLAVAIRGREIAERDRRAAETRRDTHETDAAGVRAKEREALERGELCAGDLARADGWEVRIAAERAALLAAVERARGDESGARQTEERAKTEACARRADAEVVEKDRARWTAAQLKQAEARDEDEAAEAYRPGRR
jgi:hypothetical protein